MFKKRGILYGTEKGIADEKIGIIYLLINDYYIPNKT